MVSMRTPTSPLLIRPRNALGMRSRVGCPCASDRRDSHSTRHEVWCPAKGSNSRAVRLTDEGRFVAFVACPLRSDVHFVQRAAHFHDRQDETAGLGR